MGLEIIDHYILSILLIEYFQILFQFEPSILLNVCQKHILTEICILRHIAISPTSLFMGKVKIVIIIKPKTFYA